MMTWVKNASVPFIAVAVLLSLTMIAVALAMVHSAIVGDHFQGMYKAGDSVPKLGRYLTSFTNPAYCDFAQHPHGNYRAYVWTHCSPEVFKEFLDEFQLVSEPKGGDKMNSEFIQLPFELHQGEMFSRSDTRFFARRNSESGKNPFVRGAYKPANGCIFVLLRGDL